MDIIHWGESLEAIQKKYKESKCQLAISDYGDGEKVAIGIIEEYSVIYFFNKQNICRQVTLIPKGDAKKASTEFANLCNAKFIPISENYWRCYSQGGYFSDIKLRLICDIPSLSFTLGRINTK